MSPGQEPRPHGHALRRHPGWCRDRVRITLPSPLLFLSSPSSPSPRPCPFSRPRTAMTTSWTRPNEGSLTLVCVPSRGPGVLACTAAGRASTRARGRRPRGLNRMVQARRRAPRQTARRAPRVVAVVVAVAQAVAQVVVVEVPVQVPARGEMTRTRVTPAVALVPLQSLLTSTLGPKSARESGVRKPTSGGATCTGEAGFN